MRKHGFLAVLAAGMVGWSTARAESPSDWLADTQWYVPAANLLAYLTPGSDLSTPIPIGDQTLWNITSASGGTFTGESSATLTILGQDTVSTSSMSGIVTPEGQVRIVFTPNGESAGGPVTVGIGQVRNFVGGRFMEMQMLTGTGSAYVTHWAYMAQVPDGPFTPPTDWDEGTLLSTEWAWMDGTIWNLAAPGVFGTADPAQFSVTGYRNGYFWGTGLAADGDAFTHIGSVTPEGNVLFNVLVDGVLTNLTGQIVGDATTGTMALRGYVGTENFGDAAIASVVPEPETVALLAAAGVLAMGAARRRRPATARNA
jgi:PEP-CTERM putative exosortase interaction domain